MKMTDVAGIEKQHSELVNKFSKLNDAVKKNDSRENIYKIIDDVISFTRVHFADEEQLMAQSAYPEIESHKTMHKELIDEALHLKGKFDYVDELAFRDWLNHWPLGRVLAHIKYADTHFEEYLAQKGI
jgi:hemerythrin